jgi:hypothetical protein
MSGGKWSGGGRLTSEANDWEHGVAEHRSCLPNIESIGVQEIDDEIERDASKERETIDVPKMNL